MVPMTEDMALEPKEDPAKEGGTNADRTPRMQMDTDEKTVERPANRQDSNTEQESDSSQLDETNKRGKKRRLTANPQVGSNTAGKNHN